MLNLRPWIKLPAQEGGAGLGGSINHCSPRARLGEAQGELELVFTSSQSAALTISCSFPGVTRRAIKYDNKQSSCGRAGGALCRAGEGAQAVLGVPCIPGDTGMEGTRAWRGHGHEGDTAIEGPQGAALAGTQQNPQRLNAGPQSRKIHLLSPPGKPSSPGNLRDGQSPKLPPALGGTCRSKAPPAGTLPRGCLQPLQHCPAPRALLRRDLGWSPSGNGSRGSKGAALRSPREGVGCVGHQWPLSAFGSRGILCLLHSSPASFSPFKALGLSRARTIPWPQPRTGLLCQS